MAHLPWHLLLYLWLTLVICLPDGNPGWQTYPGPLLYFSAHLNCRERAAKMYARASYITAVGVVELPYLIAQTIVFVPISYFMIGKPSAQSFVSSPMPPYGLSELPHLHHPDHRLHAYPSHH